jgi:type III secretion protein C
MKHFFAALHKLFLAYLFSLAPSGYAVGLPWSDAPYSYYAQDIPLTQALMDFAAGFSLTLQLSPSVNGQVNGRFAAKNPSDFLDQLSSVYGLAWFSHAGILYVSRTNENITKTLPASASNIGTLRQALTDLGVLVPRFGWGELADQAVAMVSGPPAYVRLIEETINKLPQVAGGQQTAIFRLKYAQVDDRTISFRGQSVITPGLASIVRNMMQAGSAPNGGGFVDVERAPGAASGLVTGGLSDLAAPLRIIPPLVSPDNSVGANRVDNSLGTSGGAGIRRVGVARRPSVQADSRLNALIVQDAPERIAIWGTLIAQLDVPTALIEIEAMIIDVNSQFLEELGISWGGRLGRVAGGFGNPGATVDGSTISIATGNGVTPSTLVVDAGNYLISRIRALEGVGDARIQSRPSILTVDNVGAVIDLSETFYVRTTGERVATVTPITTGTTLRVTPRYIDTGGERMVQLIVDIEDGKIQDRQIDQLPTVSRSTVSTQALITEEQTLLIGGYNTDFDVERKDSVPFLGKLPGIGALFSTRSKEVQKRERLFLIKPKLISVPINYSAVASGSGAGADRVR